MTNNVGMKMDPDHLYIQREKDETWREAAARTARKYGMEKEVLDTFDSIKAAEPEKDEAYIAFDACYEWDVCNLTANT